MSWVGQLFLKLGTFFTKYVPHIMPIFEKKSHLKRPVECLKLWVLHKKLFFMQAFVVASLHTGKCQMLDKIIATFWQ